MEEEDAQISKIVAFILVVIVVLLSLVLFGCSEQTRTSNTDSDAHIFWCLGACSSINTEFDQDSKHETKGNEK